MIIIIGDIGNTVTKLSLIDQRTFRIIKVLSIKTRKVNSINNLTSLLKKNKYFKKDNLIKRRFLQAWFQKLFIYLKDF